MTKRAVLLFICIVAILLLTEHVADSQYNPFSLKWAWEPATGPVARYSIAMSVDDGDFKLVGLTPDATPSYVLLGVEDGRTYRLRVQAVDARGNVGPFSDESDPTSIVFSAIDVNADGLVNGLDLLIVVSHLGSADPDHRRDVNRDRLVNVANLVNIGSRFGQHVALSVDKAQTSNHSLPKPEQVHLALAELEALSEPHRGAEIALGVLRAWLADEKSAADETRLLPSYPNPTYSETWLPYQLAIDAHVKITILDLTITVIRELDLGYQKAGYYVNEGQAGRWDGKDETGKPVASGSYLYQFEAGDFVSVRQMKVIR